MTAVADLTRLRVLELDSLEILSRAKGGDGRTVIAYAAVYNQRTEIKDLDGEYLEQIAPNAFDWSNTPGVFYHHGRTLYGTPSDLGSVPIGKPVEIKSDANGLLTVSRYNDSPLADSVLASIRNGDPMGMSFTGEFVQSDPARGPWSRQFDGGLTVVTRQRINLREYGPTPYGPASTPAYSGAEILGVRAQQEQREQITVSGPLSVQLQPPELAAETEQAADEPDPSVSSRPYQMMKDTDACSMDKPWAVKNQQTGRLHGCHASEADAKKQMAALYANEPGAGKSGRSDTDAAATGQEPAEQDTTSSGRTAPELNKQAGHSRPVVTRRGKTMTDSDRAPMTVEERAARQSEIRARLAEIDGEYSGAELTQEARAEWQGLQAEIVEHERAIADASQRAEYLRYINDNQPDATERVDNFHAGYQGGSGVPFQGGGNGRQSPAFHARDNIYDLAAIRNRARHIDEVPVLYRDYAMRAVEQARFPGATGAGINREAAQERVAQLLDSIDDEKGTLARRILVTGSPTYDRAFGKMLATQSIHGLTAEESRALALGTDSAGGYAVPFQLDPTVILTSNGAINPLRQIARVETITGKEWDGVTTAGVTVSRVSEGTEAGTGDPVFAQPTVRTTRVQGFVPFSIEMDVSWAGLRTQITSILMDAKDVEEGAGTSGFVLGNGTAPNAGGVVTTLGTAQQITTATTATLALADVYGMENSFPVRFRQQSAYLASKTTYNKLKQLAQAVTSLGGDPWVRLGAGVPGELNGYPAYEASAMSGSVTTSNALVLLQGDFSKFLIVDRVGMGIELIPHLFGATNRYPTGQRGILAIWFNNSAILVPNAFRLLKIL